MGVTSPRLFVQVFVFHPRRLSSSTTGSSEPSSRYNAKTDRTRMNPLGNVSSEFDSSGAELGIWTVEIEAFNTPIDTFTFRLYADGR